MYECLCIHERLYICMIVCMHVRMIWIDIVQKVADNVCSFDLMHAYDCRNVYAFMNGFMYVCLYVCMYYVCMYVCMYVCDYVCMYVCIYVCMYVCLYVCNHVCMYVCLY